MGYQTAPHGSLGLPCGLYQSKSLNEGTPLLFESEWVLYPAFGSPPTPTAHPTHPHRPPHPPPTRPPPIESIRDIKGAEKNHQKTSSIQVACRNSYKMLAI